MKSVLIVGGYPPPIGGITVHIQRQKQLLEENGHKVVILDLIGKSSVMIENVERLYNKSKFKTLINSLKYILLSNEKIVHYHTSAFGKFLYTSPLYLIASISKKRFITIHSGSFIDEVKNYNFIKKIIFKNIIKKFDKVIVVNEKQKIFLNSSYLENCPDKIEVIPAYLSENYKLDNIRKEVLDCIQVIRKNNRKIILSSGYMQKYYGHHIILEASEKLPKDIATVLCFYNSYDETYKQELIELKGKQPDTHFLYDLTPNEFNYVLSQSDIYIRATDRDGDAVAIREALYHGKNVLATNCVERPSNVITFDRDNLNELIDKIINTLENKGKPVTEDNSEKLKSLFL